MERRNLLIGGGTALVTVIAGCSGAETDGDDSGDDDSEAGDGTEPDGNDGDGRDGSDSDGSGPDDGSARDDDDDSRDGDQSGGNDGENGEDGDQSGGDSDDENDDNETAGSARNGIPGFDPDAFSIDSGLVTVDRVAREGDVVSVRATTETTDRWELYDELGSLGSDLEAAVTNPERFEGAIDRVEFRIVDADGDRVISFHARAEWIADYVTGRLAEDEFSDRVMETAR